MLTIVDSGVLTTVQDMGRFGYQKDGVTPSGAMDPMALRLANLLVANDESAAGLEITLKGPTIEFQSDAFIAICGADLVPKIADVTLPTWRAIFVERGSVLHFGEPRWGCRAYLAVLGGIAVREVMGSRSTYLRAGIGGLQGRALAAGDVVPIGRPHKSAYRVMFDAAAGLSPLPFALLDRRIAPDHALSLYEVSRPIHVLIHPHFELFDEHDRKTFLNEAFEVSPRSDRMGYRLSGPVLDSGRRSELISSAVLTGTVQVPAGGNPIVLMADRQTTGGYPMIAHVTSADIPLVAQLKPGDKVRFEEVTIERAQSYLRIQSDRLRTLKEGMVNHAPRRP